MGMDLFPTLAAVGGCEMDTELELDGIDLLGLLTQGESLDRRMLFWEKPVGVYMEHFRNRRFAVRDGTWSLVQHASGQPVELYDLQADPRQENNLAEVYPQRAAGMREALEAWKKEVYEDSPWDIDEYMKRFEKAGILK